MSMNSFRSEFKFLTINTADLWKKNNANQDPKLSIDDNGISIARVEETKGQSTQIKLRASSAVYISKQLDSLYPGVQWHKIVLESDIPNKYCLIEVSYYASDENTVSSSELLSQDFEKWSSPILYNPKDALLIDAKGRYLWLKISLRSLDPDAQYSPSLKSLTVFYPRLSYLRYLPAIYQENDISRDFLGRYLSIFETLLSNIENEIFSFTKYIDPIATPDDFLPWLSSWLALSYDENWPKENIRNFIKQAPFIFKKRGTREGLEEIISIYLNNDIRAGGNIQKQKKHYLGIVSGSETHDDSINNNNNNQSTKTSNQNLHNSKNEFRLVCDTIPVFKELGGRHGIAIIEGFQLASLQDPGYIKLYHPYTKKVGTYEKNDNQYRFYVLLSPTMPEKTVNSIKRIVESEKPAYTFACVKVLHPWFYLGMHTYLGINTQINRQTFILEKSTIGTDTVLETNNNNYHDYYYRENKDHTTEGCIEDNLFENKRKAYLGSKSDTFEEDRQ